MTTAAAETLVTRAWNAATGMTGDHPLVLAIWALEDALDFGDTDVDHAAFRVESVIGELP